LPLFRSPFHSANADRFMTCPFEVSYVLELELIQPGGGSSSPAVVA
jgi:hypothetical protein